VVHEKISQVRRRVFGAAGLTDSHQNVTETDVKLDFTLTYFIGSGWKREGNHAPEINACFKPTSQFHSV